MRKALKKVSKDDSDLDIIQKAAEKKPLKPQGETYKRNVRSTLSLRPPFTRDMDEPVLGKRGKDFGRDVHLSAIGEAAARPTKKKKATLTDLGKN